MKLRLDLLEHLTSEDILEEVLANNHRYKPEPLFSKTGVGSLSSATMKERAQEEARSTANFGAESYGSATVNLTCGHYPLLRSTAMRDTKPALSR